MELLTLKVMKLTKLISVLALIGTFISCSSELRDYKAPKIVSPVDGHNTYYPDQLVSLKWIVPGMGSGRAKCFWLISYQQIDLILNRLVLSMKIKMTLNFDCYFEK
ncbi:MAG: hypothetical protein KIT62_16525 [Cyclobacteriaceae bacterium]|nr:hypothetical protein [Cyclobacteriaceae bacterium]